MEESSSIMQVMPTATIDPTNEDNYQLQRVRIIAVGCAVAAILCMFLVLYFILSIKYQLNKRKKKQHRQRVMGGGGGSRAVTRQEMEFESFSKSLPEDSESDELPADEVVIETPLAAVIVEEDEFQAETRSDEHLYDAVSKENEPEIVNENANNEDPATIGKEDENQTQFERADDETSQNGSDAIYDQVASEDHIEGSDSNESVNEEQEERDNDPTIANNNLTGDPDNTLLSIDKSLEDIRKSLDDIQGALNDDD